MYGVQGRSISGRTYMKLIRWYFAEICQNGCRPPS